MALTFCAGVMYLIQERQLKSKQPGMWSNRLPSLWVLDELNAKALALGLPDGFARHLESQASAPSQAFD